MKIYIVGSVGSGKSTLARQLAYELALPCYELDAIVYDDSLPVRAKREVSALTSIINGIDGQGTWIFEGVHRESYRQLYAYADVIVLLHPPYLRRKYHIIKRYVKQQLGSEASHYPSTMKMLIDMFRWSHQFKENKFMNTMVVPFEHKVLIIRKKSQLVELIKDIRHFEAIQPTQT